MRNATVIVLSGALAGCGSMSLLGDRSDATLADRDVHQATDGESMDVRFDGAIDASGDRANLDGARDAAIAMDVTDARATDVQTDSGVCIAANCPTRSNATARCNASGACEYACVAGAADCNGLASDGCEASLNSPTSCGACGVRCSGATPLCNGTGCTSSCLAPSTICSGACVDLQSNALHCGACGNACPSGQVCTAGACRCPSGTTLCSGRCIDTDTHTFHCGGCNRVCRFTNATAVCAGGGCVLGACDPGFGNCDGNSITGCEARLDTATHCGACGNACPAGMACSAGACIPTCTMCGASCVDLNTDGNNCGRCGRSCNPPPNTTAPCVGGLCSIPRCLPGFTDCDGSILNGCDDTRTDPTNCGGCERVCTLPNATAGCSAGMCTVVSCAAGFGDCDGNAANGCETNQLTSNTHCGACGRTCSSGSCCYGTCVSIVGQPCATSDCSMVGVVTCTAIMSLQCVGSGTSNPTGLTCSFRGYSTDRQCVPTGMGTYNCT